VLPRTSVAENQAKVPPTSKLGKAFTYFTLEYEFLIGYLNGGRIEMDSGLVERYIRKFARGRNKGMFPDTEAGAEARAETPVEARALLYSLIVTAKVNGINT